MVRREIGDQHRPQQSPSSPAWSPELVPSSPPPGWREGRRLRASLTPLFRFDPRFKSQWLSSRERACHAAATGDMGLALGAGRCLRRGHSKYPSILAWRTPWTEEPGGLQSTRSQRVRHDWSDLACTHWTWKARRFVQTHFTYFILFSFMVLTLLWRGEPFYSTKRLT